MPGRLAIDFGTSNTVVAVWDEARQEGAPMHVPDYGRLSLLGDEQISVVPSLIHYTTDRRRWIGDQVLRQELYQSDRTFRWMKRYIGNRSPVKKRLDGRELSHFDAGRDFLSAVLTFAAAELSVGNEEVALTVPVRRRNVGRSRGADRRRRAGVSVMDPQTGAVLAAEFTRSRFEDLLDEHAVFTQVDQTIRRALNAARERGYSEDHIIAALMVGGSSLIPSVQKTVQRIFGRERVMLNRPLDAVARGAAAFVAGVDFYDHIQHDYAISWVNPQKGDYDYRVIVNRGAPYPTEKSVARMTVKASHDGQKQLGIAIFEVGERRQRSGAQAVELVFDPSGAARMVNLTPDEEDRRTYFWLNERTPTFLAADPPGKQGEPRFEVEFKIDENKRLLITARDVQTGRVTHRGYPVVKLT